MLRKRNDSVKPGCGVDGTEGEDYSRRYAVDPWNYPGNRNVPEDRDIKGRKVRNNAGEAAYSPDSDGASAQRGKDDFQFWAQERDIMADVESNQDEVSYGHNAIKAGVNRAQDK